MRGWCAASKRLLWSISETWVAFSTALRSTADMTLPFDPILAAFHRLHRGGCPSPYDMDNMLALRHQFGTDVLPHRPAVDLFARRLAAHAANVVGVPPELASASGSTRWKTDHHHHQQQQQQQQQQHPSPLVIAGESVVSESSIDEPSGVGNQLIVRAELEGRDLWKKFDEHCTEMVITKSGR
jgi:hypothetical protein